VVEDQAVGLRIKQVLPVRSIQAAVAALVVVVLEGRLQMAAPEAAE
jgi:uncharacterized protein YjeT (DUF2065 family)